MFNFMYKLSITPSNNIDFSFLDGESSDNTESDKKLKRKSYRKENKVC